MTRRIHTEIMIDAPADAVWRVLSDWPAYREWNPWMVQIHGVLEERERLKVRVKTGEREIGFQSTLVHVEPGRSFRWLGHLLVRGLFDGEHAFELVPEGEQRTRFVHSETFEGVLVPLVLRAIGESTEAGFVAMNEALKRRCETASASDPSSA